MVKPPPGPLARLHRPARYLAIGLMMPWPALAQVDVETASPISVITREELEKIPNGRDFASILDLHNMARAGVGSPPLRWNQGNAQRAQQVADILSETGNLQHSSRVGRENERENLVVGARSNISPLAMAQTWLDEVEVYRGGVFPDACSGDWSICAHYTQMIWSTTTDIGCGFARGQYVALVCRYSPPGNRDGRLVIELMPEGPALAAGPPSAPDAERCQVPEAEEWARILGNAAAQSGFGVQGSDPRDAPTDRQWALAIEREQEVQTRMLTELATLQGNVATRINAYLAATSAWQENYVYLASRTTTLQGALTEWLEAREIYEKADLAFAVANLGVGGVKLGFKAYRFLTAPRAAVASAETAAGATRVAGAADNAASATRAADNAAGVGASAGETAIFNRTIIPPGQNPNVAGMAGRVSGTSSTAGTQAAALRQAWEAEVSAARAAVAQARAAGDDFMAGFQQGVLDDLLRTGPRTPLPPTQPLNTAAQAIDKLDQGLVAAAREAGVNVDTVVAGAVSPGRVVSEGIRLEAQNQALMRAIAGARGWHTMPTWVGDMITNTLIQARKGLSGVDNAPIDPQLLDGVRRLKAMADARGINFADWMRKAAGEVSTDAGQQLAGATEGVLAIVRHFDEADIDLLLKVIDTGGDLTRLRNAVSPVTQASLNGLGRAAQASEVSCGALETGLGLAGVGAAAGNNGASSAPSGPPTDAQLEAVLYGTGKLGEVGLGNVIDQFGVTDRFTAGQGLPRAIAGELWELISSPSTTIASHYFTHQAQSEYLDLLRTESTRMVGLGTRLTAASNALRDLQDTLQRAGLNGPGSYLSTRGPADLRRALDDLERVYRSGSDDWQRAHKGELDARRDHINQKLAALAETVTDLNALAGRLAQMRTHLDSLRLNADGSLREVVDLFNPIVFVRLGSISLFLRGMGADAFGISSGPPFTLSTPSPAPQPASAPGEDFETMRAREAERLRVIDEAPEAEVDPDFETWLNGLEGGQ